MYSPNVTMHRARHLKGLSAIRARVIPFRRVNALDVLSQNVGALVRATAIRITADERSIRPVDRGHVFFNAELLQ